MIRKANQFDIKAVTKIYDELHQVENNTGWERGLYPTEVTAQRAVQREDLFVYELDGEILGAAIINQVQDDAYQGENWEYEVSEDEVCVIHTLVVSPSATGRGIGKEFVKFYEDYALKNGWYELRFDTNEKNEVARKLYTGLGYREIAIVPTVFNGIPDTNLVLFEKNLRP